MCYFDCLIGIFKRHVYSHGDGGRGGEMICKEMNVISDILKDHTHQ